MELAKKLSLTCRSEREDREAEAKQAQEDADLEELLDDEFLKSYMQKRMQEMVDASVIQREHFGHVLELQTGEDFLRAIDNDDHKNVTVVVHIWEDGISGCGAVNGCLANISKDYPYTKFCRIKVLSK